MGYSTLSIIPTDPHFAPSREAIRRAVLLMEKYFPYPRDHEIRVYESPHPRFFAEDSSCYQFVCPACRKKTTYDEFNTAAGDEEAWYFFIEAAEGAPDATAYSIETPCCKKSLLLSELIFEDSAGKTAGISRFRISLTGVEEALSEEERSEMEKALGCTVIQVITSGT